MTMEETSGRELPKKVDLLTIEGFNYGPLHGLLGLLGRFQGPLKVHVRYAVGT